MQSRMGALPRPPTLEAERLGRGRWATGVAFRAFASLLILALHTLAFEKLAADRMKLPFNSAPGEPPSAVNDDADWSRLVVSRWDSQHYISLVETGFSRCPPSDLRGADLHPCMFHFYPGYPLVGRAVKWLFHLPTDYALWAVSLAASFVFLFLWTGPALSGALGVWPTYLSLFLFNVFTTGFSVVTLQTEPLALLSLLGAFVCLHRKHWLSGAVVAGMGGAIRVTGGAIGAGYGLALVVHALIDRTERRLVRWGRVVLAAPLCGWGQLAIFGYFWKNYKDPFLYTREHSQVYGHSIEILDALWPKPAVVMRALTMGMHEGLFVFLGLFFLALGARAAMSGFTTVERVYWYATSSLVLAVGLIGTAGLAFAGMNRYLLVVLPLFFSMATVLRRRYVALAVWSVFSMWHYWNVDLCIFIAQWSAPQYCNITYRP
jgi:hypothetical protein